MNHASLFSGIGGFDLAAHWMGWQNIFWCENDEFCNKILGYYFPNAIPYGNIKETNFRKHHGQIDILTGGFPCQPFSDAGLKGGTSDPRYLWPEMYRAIREIRPRWVIAENVRGLISWNAGLVFETVRFDLENEGYEVWPFLLPACGVDAPHQRYRVWYVAYRTDTGTESLQRERENRIYETGPTTDTDSHDAGRRRFGKAGCEKTESERKEQERKRLRASIKRISEASIIADTDHFDGDLSGFGAGEISQFDTSCVQRNNVADPASDRLQERGKVGASAIGREVIGFDGFPTQSPVCGGNDGLSSRLDGITFPKWRQQSIKGFGNAVVPQIPYMLFKIIVDFERTLKLFE